MSAQAETATITTENVQPEDHPIAPFIRMDRMPHIWCPTCGIGTVVKCYAAALEKLDIDPKTIAIVSGIGCTGRVAGYMNYDAFHTTHGRAIAFATGLKMARTELNVTLFSGDGDLSGIGGNHFIHAARRNMDLTVIMVNNFNYGMTGGQLGPTTPLDARTSTSRYGNYDPAFNVPYLAEASGAVYVARWTALHVRRLENSFTEALQKKGFSVVEVISPCPALYGRMNRQPSGLDQMKYYRESSIIKHGADTRDADIDLNGKIIIGKFIDKDRPTFSDLQENVRRRTFGDKEKEDSAQKKIAAVAKQ